MEEYHIPEQQFCQYSFSGFEQQLQLIMLWCSTAHQMCKRKTTLGHSSISLPGIRVQHHKWWGLCSSVAYC